MKFGGYKIMLLWLTFQVNYSQAHNPHMGSFHLSNYDSVWILCGSLSQIDLQFTLERYYSNIKFENVSKLQFKQLAIAYIKAHIKIQSQNEIIDLSEGEIYIGNHQSDFRFILERLPALQSITSIQISCLSENVSQQNILEVPAINVHEILSKYNYFSVKVGAKEKIGQAPSTSNILLIVSLALALSIHLCKKPYRFTLP